MAQKTKKSKSTASILAIIFFVILGGVFLVTGNDPLGIFTPEEITPTSVVAVVEGDAPTVEQSQPVATRAAEDWYQIYFTDPNTINDPENLAGSIPENLIERINNAKQVIHIAAFEFNLTPVAEALIAAHERGVDVRWVTDDEHGIDSDEEDGHGQFAMLKDAGIQVKDDQRGALMHNKFIIFDNQTVWTGSTNLTVNGNFHNNNNVIVIQSTRLAAIYELEFDELWAGEFGPRSPSTVERQSLTINGTPIQVLFAPEDKVMEKLVPIIEEAQHNIRFMAFSFTYVDLGEAVMARAEAGVDVKGIFETRGSQTEYSELPAMYCAGLAVRQDGNPQTFHHKVIIIDDEIVITGSLNFSNNADSSNDENVIILANSDIAAQYLAEFDRRWAEAQAPDAADMNCK